jgi:valyl-tRNA synthetase
VRKFLERAWEWKAEYAATIRQAVGKARQLTRLYSRERFTMDEGMNAKLYAMSLSLYIMKA